MSGGHFWTVSVWAIPEEQKPCGVRVLFSHCYTKGGGMSRNRARASSLSHLQMRQQKRNVPGTHLCADPTERKSDLLNCG